MSNLSGPSLDPLRFPQRRSVRLKEHDYSCGIYFVTICVYGRRPLLGRVKRGQVFLSSIGHVVADEWLRTNSIRSDVWTDAFVVMPDHFHGLVGLGPLPDADLGSAVDPRTHAVRPYIDGPVGLGPLLDADLGSAVDPRAHAVRPYIDGPVGLGPPSHAYLGSAVAPRAHAVRPYLGRFIAGLKSACTRRYREIMVPVAGALWQRGYYEHVVRGTGELDRIRRYIANNPMVSRHSSP